MKKKKFGLLKNNNGFSFIEIMVALFFIAFVLGSILMVSTDSVTIRVDSEKVTRADAAAQKFTEGLYTTTYASALAMQGLKRPIDGFFMDVSIKPSGSEETAVNPALSYAHIVFTGDGKCILVGPDGKYDVPTTPASINYSATSAGYTLTYDGVTISGAKTSAPSMVVINGMKMASGSTTITLASGINAVVYCKAEAKDNTIKVIGGVPVWYLDVAKADKMLVNADLKVYGDSAGKDKYTSVEGMIQLGY